MQLISWLRHRMTARPQARHSPARKPRASFRPTLEALEARDVPSTLTVTSAADSGTGSLRADIAAAQPGDTINFAPSLNGQTITLTSGELVVNKSLTIQGPGAGQLAISGGNTWGVFEVYGTGTNVLLSGLTITQGNGQGSFDPFGGGILNANGSNLTISDCVVSNNSDTDGGGIANFNGSTLKIVNSTLSGNYANDPYGGIGGAVYSNGGSNVSMTGCTLLNNRATGSGGAIWILNTTMTINGCTFSGNIAYNYSGGAYSPSTGNDIFNDTTYSTTKKNSSLNTLAISDSIFSNNTPYSFDPILGSWINKGGNTGV